MSDTQEAPSNEEKKEMVLAGNTGLMNMGNTCFLNSALQNISHIIPLKEYFLHKKFVDDIEKEFNKIFAEKNIVPTVEILREARDHTLAYQTFQILDGMWKGLKIIRPRSFLAVLAKKAPIFGDGKQHDSQEVLQCILDSLHMELGRKVEPKFVDMERPVIEFVKVRNQCLEIIENANTPMEMKMATMEQYVKYKVDHREASVIYQSYKFWKKYIKHNRYSIITDLFDGIVHSAVTCPNCSYISDTFDAFRFWSVPIPEHSRMGISSLEECMRLFTQPETLDDDNKYKCERCTQMVRATRRVTLWEPPRLLMIQLKRFNKVSRGGGMALVKNNSHVNFPLNNLMLREYLSPFRRDLVYKYELYAVNNHHGDTLGGGHYTSMCCNHKDNKWYHFDDGNVIPMSDPNKVVTSNAYMLFYKLKSNDSR
jgi:ubiquitin carboxyl-terminal hydrolase 8